MSKVYRGTMLSIWLVSSAVIVLDRFYWNVWPRQTICTDGCGNDFFCPMDEVRTPCSGLRDQLELEAKVDQL